MKTRTILLVLLMMTLPLSGCVQNMRDLKERVGAAEGDLEPAAVDPEPVVENATPLKPPVARMSIYGTNGALLYQAGFQAEDVEAPLFVAEETKLTLVASDSETLETNATIASYVWSIAGTSAEGRQTTGAVGGPGKYEIRLNVTDSLGSSDEQLVVLAVAPKPFEVVLDLKSGMLAGANEGGQSAGDPADVAFALASEVDGKPVKVQSVSVVANPDLTCDAILEVLGPDGTSLGQKDEHGATDLTQSETVELAAVPAGDYLARLTPYACVAPEGVAVQVTITYIEVVEGLDGGDGHGGHAH